MNIVLRPNLCQTNLEREMSCYVFIFTFRFLRYIFYDTIFYLQRNNNVVIGKDLDWLHNKV